MVHRKDRISRVGEHLGDRFVAVAVLPQACQSLLHQQPLQLPQHMERGRGMYTVHDEDDTLGLPRRGLPRLRVEPEVIPAPEPRSESLCACFGQTKLAAGDRVRAVALVLHVVGLVDGGGREPLLLQRLEGNGVLR